MFWSEYSNIEYSTTYIEYLTLHRKSAFLHRIKISSSLKFPVHCSGSLEALKKVICHTINLLLALSTCNCFHLNLEEINKSQVTSIQPAAIISLYALPSRFHEPDSFPNSHPQLLCASPATPISPYYLFF